MSCSSHTNSHFYSTNNPINTHYKHQKKAKNPEKDRDFSIPHISKKMNTIQKYIQQYSSKPQDSRAFIKADQLYKNQTGDHSIERDPSNHFHSVDVHDFNTEDKQSKGINCVKYESIVNKKSEDRLQKLTRLQKDYSLLKQKINPHVHKKCLTGELTARRTIREFGKDERGDISQEDVEKEIKNTLVSDNGKKYFADLYLLKKGRQNIMNSLSNAGKFTLGGGTETVSVDQLIGKQSYQQKIRANEKDFVCNKIVNDRQKKRNQMIKGRHLNWNVYYDILALSSNEKQKLKTLCKFPSKFGIV